MRKHIMDVTCRECSTHVAHAYPMPFPAPPNHTQVKSSGSKAASVDGYAYGELHSSVEAPVPASMQDSSTDRADRVDTEASVEDTTRDASECGAGKTRIRIVTSSPQHFHHIQKDSPAMIRSRSSRSIIAVSKETADTSTSCNNIAPGCIVNLFGTRSRSRSDACDPSGAGLRSDNGGEGGSSYELIPLRNMHVTFISGLRGAVSFACATGNYGVEVWAPSTSWSSLHVHNLTSLLHTSPPPPYSHASLL